MLETCGLCAREGLLLLETRLVVEGLAVEEGPVEEHGDERDDEAEDGALKCRQQIRLDGGRADFLALLFFHRP